ncbi:hypothetical protein GWN26_02310, partial [Candidatus Saccharibacteria bacterium]|nr:hypothetical protein [Candidatus Saccharibacteria bacterium]NIV71480.1 hypothetical protein [Calditrichia bacterium]NIV98034.1 hypothetical protein [Candidatus Saccharibacteria bacterium]NIW78332.1 hypothetical protein [Calditrichia bacterium]
MYNAILLILLGSAIILVISGLSKGKNGRIVAGILVGLLTIFFFWVLDFWGEYLWFAAIEQGQRFWTLFLSESFLAVLGALLSGVIVYILTLAIPEEKKIARIGAPLLGALIGGVWGTANWEVILKFWHRTAVGVADPILGKDASFYLFSLPFYERLYTLLIILAVLSLVAILFATFFRIRGGELELQLEGILLSDRTKLFRWIYIIAAIIVFLLAVSKFLNRYHLMYSTWGAVTGPGWTDVQIRLPGYAIVILITVLSGIALLLPPIRIRISQMFRRSSPGASGNPITPLIVIGAAMLLIWFLALTAVPGLFQWLRVEPNEITFEKPYIA